MKTLPILATALVAFSLLAPATALAAKADAPKASKAKLIEKYDANKNGKLDADELAQIKSDFLADPKGELKRLDADKDGKLSDDELKPLTTEKKGKTAAEPGVGGKKKKGI